MPHLNGAPAIPTTKRNPRRHPRIIAIKYIGVRIGKRIVKRHTGASVTPRRTNSGGNIFRLHLNHNALSINALRSKGIKIHTTRNYASP